MTASPAGGLVTKADALSGQAANEADIEVNTDFIEARLWYGQQYVTLTQSPTRDAT